MARPIKVYKCFNVLEYVVMLLMHMRVPYTLLTSRGNHMRQLIVTDFVKFIKILTV